MWMCVNVCVWMVKHRKGVEWIWYLYKKVELFEQFCWCKHWVEKTNKLFLDVSNHIIMYVVGEFLVDTWGSVVNIYFVIYKSDELWFYNLSAQFISHSTIFSCRCRSLLHLKSHISHTLKWNLRSFLAGKID